MFVLVPRTPIEAAQLLAFPVSGARVFALRSVPAHRTHERLAARCVTAGLGLRVLAARAAGSELANAGHVRPGGVLTSCKPVLHRILLHMACVTMRCVPPASAALRLAHREEAREVFIAYPQPPKGAVGLGYPGSSGLRIMTGSTASGVSERSASSLRSRSMPSRRSNGTAAPTVGFRRPSDHCRIGSAER